MISRKYPTVGCCGIDCGLCPRYYTEGSSRCPGCGGEGFSDKHPSCSFITCCVKKHGLEVCAGCEEFRCRKYDRETVEKDSFVTHRRAVSNLRQIADTGIDAFLEQQSARIEFLKTALTLYDDGRSKSFLCLSAALLPVYNLKTALERAAGGENLRDILTRTAEAEGVELKLRS